MRWGTLERVPQTPQNFSKTGLRLPGIGTDARFRDFSCSLPLPCRPDTRGRGHLLRRLSQCCFRLSPGDARCKAPCIRKLKIPPSPEGKGVGGMGQKSKPRAGLAGDKECTPPVGHLLRRLSQCRFRLSPGDARGEAPCIRKLKTPPSPEGKGVGGMGAEKQAKGKVSQRGGELFQESPGASLPPPGATAVLPQKRRRRSASDRGSPTAHRSAQCGGKSWR